MSSLYGASPQLGEAMSIEALYVENNSWLKNWLVRKTHCSELAADLAQDTFIRLLRRGESLQVDEPRAFLCTVAKGVLANHFRRKDIETAYFSALANLEQECTPSLEEQHQILALLIEIDERLEQLAPPVREAFFMFQLDGLKQADIAHQLGISLATVKRYITKALLVCCFDDD